MDKIDLSIIVISFNTKKVTKQMIDSVYSSLKNDNKFSFEIIVVDNSSKDGSVKMLERFERKKKNFTLVKSNVNLGFGKANNLAVGIAKGKYLLFLNSDIVVLDDAISKLFLFYRKEQPGFLGGKLLNKEMSVQPSAGPFYTLPVVFAALFMKGDYWGLSRYSPNNPKEVDWVSGACIMTTKRIFEEVGGFDEGIFMYMEEIDLLYRAKKRGYSVWFYPGARFIHYGSVSSGGKTYPIIQVYRGFIYFYKKHRTKFEFIMLEIMLKFKAIVGMLIGKLFKNKYLINTYGEALKEIE